MRTRTRTAADIGRKLVLIGAAALICTALACNGRGQMPDDPVMSAAAQHELGEAAGRQDVVMTSDGLELVLTEHGAGTPTLVLVHCWCCDQSFWKNQVNALSTSYHMVTIDLPGHGASAAGRAEWTLAAYGSDVQTAVDHLSLDEVVLVGHSMGAPVALEAARLLGDRVVGVISIDNLHDVESETDIEAMERFAAALESDFSARCDAFVRSMFPPETADEPLMSGISSEMCDADPEIAMALLRQLFVYDAAAAFRAIDAPIRCINSAMVPTNIEGNSRHADFDARVMEGVGHFPHMERPEEFNQVLDELVGELISGPSAEPGDGAETG